MKTRLQYLSKAVILLLFIQIYSHLDVKAQEIDLAGVWKGAIEIPGSPLELSLKFEKESDAWKGSLDIPIQGVKDMALAELKVEGRNISFKLPEVPGNSSFAGSLEEGDQVISGTFSQATAELPLKVERESEEQKRKEKLNTEESLAKLREFIQEGLERAEVPGLSMGIVKDGEVIMVEGFGYKDLENKERVSAKTQFAIGSASKSFTAMGLALLEDQGDLDWTKAVSSYIMEFEMQDEFASKEMTAVDLLSHRSGLPRHDLLWYSSDLSRNELLSRIKYLEPSASFRTKFQYQNLMFMTAGILAERLSGMSWEDYTQKKILEPLGMINSNFSVEMMQGASDFAFPYRKQEEKVEKIPFRNIDAIGPAGSINSSAEDMVNWIKLHLAMGEWEGETFVSRENVVKMHSPHMLIGGGGLSLPGARNFTYGLGWFIYDYQGVGVVQHGGNIDGFSALMYLIPEKNIGMVILTNMNGSQLPTLVATHAHDLFLDLEETDWLDFAYKEKKEEEDEDEKKEEEKKITGTQPSHELKAYVGEYTEPGYGSFYVSLESDQLKGKYNQLDFRFEHKHYDVFNLKTDLLAEAQPVQFHLDIEGQIDAISVTMDASVSPIHFVKEAPNLLSDPEFLEKLVGDYQWDETEIQISRKGNKLSVFISGQGSLDLVPYKDTSYKIKGLEGHVLEFVVEGDHAEKIFFREPDGVYEVLRKE
ncbi:MAG: serine hydrolase [Bacteroidota bacterium]